MSQKYCLVKLQNEGASPGIRRLEIYSQARLGQSWVVASTSDGVIVRSPNGISRWKELGVIEDVEELSPEIDPPAL